MRLVTPTRLALMCTAQDRIGGITGDPAVKVIAPEGWVRGNPLVVCSQLKVGIGTGIIPLPERPHHPQRGRDGHRERPRPLTIVQWR